MIKAAQRIQSVLFTIALLNLMQLAFCLYQQFGRTPRYRTAMVEICMDKCIAEMERRR